MLAQPMVKQPVEVLAVQFVGGYQNAKDIIEWGAGLKLEIDWSYEHKVRPADVHGKGAVDKITEHLYVQYHGRLTPGDWLVIGTDGEPQPISNEDIHVLYRKGTLTESNIEPPVELPAPMPAMHKPAGRYVDRYMSPGPMS